MKPTWEREWIQLFHGDCRDVLPSLSGVDAVVTDPPYGIGEAAGKNKSRGNLAVAKDYGCDSWDDKPMCGDVLAEVLRVATWQIIFGGNYYDLPPTSCWLVWDKLNGTNDFADCELAWTNLKKAVRRIQFRWNGMIRDGYDGERVHPTQKPVDVMQWCLSHLPANSDVILDPFMGSGTTGVACIRTGRKFIGIEKEKKYFDIAVKRITDELDRAPLFKANQEVQGALFDGTTP
jgi:DNA modification methylase